MPPNDHDLIIAYNDAVHRLGNVLHLLYIMNFYYSPLFVRIAEEDFWSILARYNCRKYVYVHGDNGWRRSLLNEVLLWCWLVEQDAKEYMRHLCYAIDATGNIPGNISGYQIHNENLMVQVPPAPRAVGERTTMPAGRVEMATIR